MRRQCVCLSVLLLLIGCVLPVCAQRGASGLPSVMKFTGTLTGSDGQPLRGTVGVNFYLYAEKEGGAPLWMETQNVHADKNGRYSVMLGASGAYGLAAEVFAGSGGRWLGVQASGQPEQARSLLFSLPYGGGVPASGAEAQAASPTQAAEGMSPLGSQKKAPTVHGNGVVNFIPLWTDTSVIGESVLSQSGSLVGVGTSTPATNLDVFSSTQGVHAPIAQFGSTGPTDSNSILTYNGTGRTEMFQTGCANCFIPGAQAGDGGVRVSKGKNILFGDSGTSRLTLDSAGNAEQPRIAGGMVKAMIFFSPNNGGKIVSCFNSTLIGAAATTAPCGFGFDMTGIGDYVFFFPFQVDDRFFSLTGSAFTGTLSVCHHFIGPCDHAVGDDQVEVYSAAVDGSFHDSKVYMIIY